MFQSKSFKQSDLNKVAEIFMNRNFADASPDLKVQ